MRVSVKVNGLREIDKALGQLPKATARNALQRVGIKALEPMRATAQSLAPDDLKTPDPDLESSIAIGTRQHTGRRIRQRETFAEVYMGPTKAGYPQAMPIEFGSAAHSTAKKGRGRKNHPGNAPQPYMRPAWDQHQDQLLADVRTGLWDEIKKATERYARKLARKG